MDDTPLRRPAPPAPFSTPLPLLGAVALLGFASSIVLPQESPPPAPRFSSRVEVVSVEVSVLDRQGVPVAGLPKEAFDLLEDGVRQEIVSFEAVDLRPPAVALPSPETPGGAVAAPGGAAPGEPWTHVLIVDDIHLTPAQVTDVRKAALAFVGTLAPGTRVVLVTTGTRVLEDRRLPQGRVALESRLRALRGALGVGTEEELLSDQEAYDIHVRHLSAVEDQVARRLMSLENLVEPPTANDQRQGILRGITESKSRAAKRYYLMTLRARTTLGVLRNALTWLARVPGRRTLVLASRGFMRDPSLPEYEEVARASLQAGVAVNFLDARNQGSFTPYEGAEYGPALDVTDLPQTLANRFSEAAGSESVALETGGAIIHRPANLARAVAQLVSAARTCYLLGFQSSNPARDGRFRRLEVRLHHGSGGRSVVGRRGYYAPRG